AVSPGEAGTAGDARARATCTDLPDGCPVLLVRQAWGLGRVDSRREAGASVRELSVSEHAVDGRKLHRLHRQRQGLTSVQIAQLELGCVLAVGDVDARDEGVPG